MASGYASRHTFAPGEAIFTEGERGEIAYIIERGRVNVTRESDREVLHIATLGSGEVIGEMALIDDAPRSATATAAEETELFVVDRDLLRQRLRAADPMLRLLMRVLLDRMRRSQSRLSGAPATGPATLPPDEAPRAYGEAERRAIGLFKFEHELKQGLASDQFELLLQPIVDLDAGETAGFEALMSWHHPVRGRLAPSNFIGIAERSGLVRELDDLALRLAIRAQKQLTAGRAAGQRPLRISVNLSGVHADDDETVDRVRAILREEAFAPEALTMEITESWLVSDPDNAQQVLSGLKELGLNLALDDFGTGYSSLAYLHRFPMDYLKVDRSFTQNMLSSEGSTKIVRAVVALAHSFDLQTIAEGIDDPAQIPALRAMACEYGQGYHFGRPLKAEQARAYLEREAAGRRPG